MSITRRTVAALVAAGAALGWAAGGARAQSAPPQSVRIVVGFAAGTAPDTLARIVAAGMQKATGQTVVIENAAGAGGQIAAARVAKAAPDGATLLLGELGSVAIAPYAFTSLPYDPEKDFAPIAEIARSNFVFVVPARAPHASLAEFVARAKGDKPALLATFGVTSPGHIAAELFGQVAGFKVEPVHYRAPADAMTDLGNAQTAGAFFSVPLAAANLQGGLIKALAQTGPARAGGLPDVPTTREAGMPDLDMSSWFVLLAPTGTPAAMLEQFNAAALAALRDPDSLARLRGAGFEPTGTSTAATAEMIRQERPRWKAVVEKAGIRVTQ
jgi:tripartite-type tricarboxylate transporter receptor subunit TctC